MFYIAKTNAKGIRTYLMTDGIFRAKPAYCTPPQSKYDLARAWTWKNFVWGSDSRAIAENFSAYLTRGKRLSNKPFVTNSLID